MGKNLKASLEKMAYDSWSPIEKAPKDAKWLIGFEDGEQVPIMWYGEYWYDPVHYILYKGKKFRYPPKVILKDGEPY